HGRARHRRRRAALAASATVVRADALSVCGADELARDRRAPARRRARRRAPRDVGPPARPALRRLTRRRTAHWATRQSWRYGQLADLPGALGRLVRHTIVARTPHAMMQKQTDRLFSLGF